MDQKKQTMNALVMKSVKCNLTKDPVKAVSKDGREYWWTNGAANGVNKKGQTWFPRIMFFREAMAVASTLKQGDFIHITHALLSPGELNGVYEDKASGEFKPQSSALLITPQESPEGLLIPVRVIKRRETEKKTTPEQVKLPLKEQELNEADVIATIG